MARVAQREAPRPSARARRARTAARRRAPGRRGTSRLGRTRRPPAAPTLWLTEGTDSPSTPTSGQRPTTGSRGEPGPIERAEDQRGRTSSRPGRPTSSDSSASATRPLLLDRQHARRRRSAIPRLQPRTLALKPSLAIERFLAPTRQSVSGAMSRKCRSRSLAMVSNPTSGHDAGRANLPLCARRIKSLAA